eukprot:scaffold30428_cov125-Isochrysis_galbana.AAC.3
MADSCSAEPRSTPLHTCAKLTLVLAVNQCGLNPMGNGSRVDVYASPHRVNGDPQHTRSGFWHGCSAEKPSREI